MKKSGFFWHIHHDTLFGWSDDINERIEYIKTEKPGNEIETRLRLLQPVKGKLPEEVIRARNAFDKARNAFDKARDAYYKAGDAYNKAGDAYIKVRDAYYKARNAFDKAWNAYHKAGDAYNKARDAYYKARDTYDKAIVEHLPEIELLHKQECKNCPWDGRTIFPRRKEEEK